MLLAESDKVWNRACLEDGGFDPGSGDRALTDLLLFDSLAGNGGLFHVFDALDEREITAAFLGFQYFGLDEILSFLEHVSTLTEDQQDELSTEYWELTKNGDAIQQAFERHFDANPQCYYPTD